MESMKINIQEVIPNARYYEYKEQKTYNLQIETIYTIMNNEYAPIAYYYLRDSEETSYAEFKALRTYGIFDMSRLSEINEKPYVPFMDDRQLLTLTLKVLANIPKSKYVIETYSCGFLVLDKITNVIVKSCVYWGKYIDATHKGNCWKSYENRYNVEYIRDLFEGTTLEGINFLDVSKSDYVGIPTYSDSVGISVFSGTDLQLLINLLFVHDDIDTTKYHNMPEVLWSDKYDIPEGMTLEEAADILGY